VSVLEVHADTDPIVVYGGKDCRGPSVGEQTLGFLESHPKAVL
jgi:hypothetical protein